MPITLEELRANPTQAADKLRQPCANPLFDQENHARRLAAHAELRRGYRRLQSRYRDGQLVGEKRKLARRFDVSVATLTTLATSR